MEKIVFNPYEKPTVGVEVEAKLVDNDYGDLVNIEEGNMKKYNDEDRVKNELYLSTVEITSTPQKNTNETDKELSTLFNKV